MSVVTTMIVPPVLNVLYRGTALPWRQRWPRLAQPSLLPQPKGATRGDFAAAGRLPGFAPERESPREHGGTVVGNQSE
jgi:hypothetical protein